MVAAAMVAVVVVAGRVAYRTIAADGSSADPLTVWAVEPVPSRVAGVAGPAIHVGDDVITTSHKCNHTGTVLVSHSVKSWQTLDDAGIFNGFNVSADNGLQTYPPGCKDYRYSNPMPPTAVTRNAALFSAGAKSVLWRLTAVETPELPGSRPAMWVSEPFKVVP